MKKKVLIGIAVLCILGVILFLAFGKETESEITQYGETNSFESDSKLLNDAWEISFTDEDDI